MVCRDEGVTTSDQGGEPGRRSRCRRWSLWLLLVPFAALLDPALYAHEHPRVAGVPFFVWYQFTWVLLGAVVTWVVYRLRRGSGA